jgi:RND family efflux transporter MFP subunit
MAAGGLLLYRADASTNKVALASAPKPVTAFVVRSATYRDARGYVGTLRPWVEANVGPQFVSAYVDTVLVRPGASVKRNAILATLDCRNTTASSRAMAAEARALDARQQAMTDESTRLDSMLDGGFVSPNEAEQKHAQSTSEEAQLNAQTAKLAATTLAVDDCVLRAPFDGEVSARSIDPGAFVRPGTPIVTLVNRDTVRMTFDVPETEAPAAAPKTVVSVTILATGRTIAAPIARRSPAADPETRTVHVEVDLPNADHAIAVNTTGEVRVETGDSKAASVVPLVAASIAGSKATLFVVEDGVARRHAFAIQGEEGGELYLDPSLEPGSRVVTEGRALLADGDPVSAAAP